MKDEKLVSEECDAAKAKLQSYMGRTARIKITDKRIFEGQLVCIDQQGNVILFGTTETCPMNPEEVAFGNQSFNFGN